MTINRVRPGEIISSTLINFILDKLEELEARLDAPSTGDIQIERFDPPNGTPVGDRLSIIGRNFVFPPDENVVTVDNTLIREFVAPSTSAILTFVVPDSIDIIDEDGEDVTIRVSNEVHGTTQARYRLLPPRPNQGPPPVITEVLGVRNDGSTSSTLRFGETALIRGSNFAEELAANQVRFLFGPNEFPVNDISDASTTTELRFTVPTIDDEQVFVTVEIRTPNGVAVAEGVRVRPPAG